ncbi:glycoside hydrolase family 76 protein [Xylariomycetidae sp. FL2044]|nr:glycoside hydrolase family 76 protein [Xylariomycetidae sp. FL2044]
MVPAFPNAAYTAALLSMATHLVHTYELDVQSTDSIKSTAKDMAADLLSFYKGNQPGQTPGLLPDPYYWWEAGAMMGALIDYWYYTGDTTYNDLTMQGLLHQVGPYNDYMPPNQTLTEGNDDQGFWGMAVMSAAEYKFDNPPDGQPQWLALAQAVFNTQAARWETDHCNGGLRWQIFQWNNGYDYKNSISQACFFNIAARLALYTGNATYADWAVKTWDWISAVKLLDENYRIYDGAHTTDNCSVLTPYEFSYNVGGFLLGAAAMVAYSDNINHTGDVNMWHERVDGLLNSTEFVFFFGDNTTDKVMFEVACEGVNLCNTDQRSFKAYLSRWMAAATKWAPWTFDRVKTLLQNSAIAAAKQCTGGDNGRMCGSKWANNSGQWDGTTGVGQQMSAMEVVLANMIQQAEPPVTNSTGGTSVGNPSAGGSDDGRYDPVQWHHGPIDDGDRAGAIVCTVVVLGTLFVALTFMMADETKSPGDNWDSFRSSLSTSPAAAAAMLTRRGGGGGGAIIHEKGKAVASERSSSAESGDGAEESAAYGSSGAGAVMGAYHRRPPPVRPRDARKRLSRSVLVSNPAIVPNTSNRTAETSLATRHIDPRRGSSTLRKKKGHVPPG